jgi:hypothetical protein
MNAFMCPACGETTEAIGARLCIVCGAKVCDDCFHYDAKQCPRCHGRLDLPLPVTTPEDTTPEGHAWAFEDELPDWYPYDDLFPLSKVDGVRMFPSLEFARGWLAREEVTT